MNPFDIPEGQFRGHAQQNVWTMQPDPELTEVGPGTPCGEYLRRHWMPVALVEQVTDLPFRLRILGEDLVLFREKGGRLGLTHLFCRHRNMSLEFGIVEHGGIRCSYHGWKYALDGEVLETPCEPPASQVRHKACLGAYPVIEFKGIVFTYMGPPDTMPPFPVFDTFDGSGSEMIPYLIASPCNWLQVMENAWDPFHTVYLHTKAARVQFTAAFAAMPRIEFFERVVGEFYTNTRRVGDHVWVRIHDKLLPSFTQNGAHFPTGEAPVYFGRCGLTRWVVPVDDENTLVIAWRHFRDGDDPLGLTDKTQVGLGKVDFYGQSGDRDYETRQRDPGDYDAWVSQGPRNIHGRENLCFTDRGVAKVRNKLRREIRAVAAGGEAAQASGVYRGTIPTYGGDTILRIPPIEGADDNETLRTVAHKVAEIYKAADSLEGEARAAQIVADLKAYEATFA